MKIFYDDPGAQDADDWYEVLEQSNFVVVSIENVQLKVLKEIENNCKL